MRILAVLFVIVTAAAAAVFAAPAAGVVLEDRLVKAGDQVDDAQPLVYVRTPLTGTIGVAARAPRDGVIREVLVQPGQRIERGDIVIRLQPR